MPVISLRPLQVSRFGTFAGTKATPLLAPQSLTDDRSFSMALLRDRVVSSQDMVLALGQQAADGGRLIDILLARRFADDLALYACLSRQINVTLADFEKTPCDTRILDQLSPVDCLQNGLIPWMRCGDATLVATAYPEDFAKHSARLTALFGPVVMALAAPRQIEAVVLTLRGPRHARAAESRVAEIESCRNWKTTVAPWLGLVALGLVLFTVVQPKLMLLALSIWAVVTLVCSMGLKLAALIASLRTPDRDVGPGPIIARLPTVSVMVALYRESDIAARLVRRLGRLDYPHDLLDIVLVVEEQDRITRDALGHADLPPWMRVVVAPKGQVTTKPRALNYALDHCRGSIIGVYDAEDAPEPDQIRKVVDRFIRRGPDVACLQGVLDFYNPETNWLSRCFTVEYAAWFRVMLPGLERLGLPLPLGGTTLFFRRAALESLGGWDAHNVTEDADLGIRLARHGFRTELIATVTLEEANCRTLPWIKQRSRWIKGYMMTYATHMRNPLQTLRDLGAWRFAGFQILVLGSLSQALLVPLLWSFWAMTLGLPHPIAGLVPHAAILTISVLFILCEAVTLTTGFVGLHRTGHRFSRAWVPTLHLYYPLAALSSYKAAWELLSNPFYWDKTSHGHFEAGEAKDGSAPMKAI